MDEYMTFIKSFGTHFVSEFKMGARYGFISRLTQDNYIKLLKKGINVQLAASASYAGVTGNSTTNSTYEKELAEEFNKVRNDYKIFTMGKKLPSDGKPETWADDALNDPMPISYKLFSLAFIFKHSSNFKLKPGRDYQKLYENMKIAYTDYCEQFKKSGLITSCSDAEDDKPIPSLEIPGSCRLCSTCGNDYTEESGALAVNAKNWRTFFWSYGEKCGDKMGQYNFVNGMKLCCKKESAYIHSTCKQCLSCGGDYQFAGGVVCDRGGKEWAEFISSYDHQCYGELRQRMLNAGDCAQLCCKQYKNKPICNYCLSCGGNWTNEVGAMGEDLDWPPFYKTRGKFCSGEIGKPESTKAGLSLCCSDAGLKALREGKLKFLE